MAVSETDNAFSGYQKWRREDLWGLLGDLPWQHEPAPPQIVRTEEHESYTLQRLVLDLNGIEPVPALLTIPKRLECPAPGLLFSRPVEHLLPLLAYSAAAFAVPSRIPGTLWGLSGN